MKMNYSSFAIWQQRTFKATVLSYEFICPKTLLKRGAASQKHVATHCHGERLWRKPVVDKGGESLLMGLIKEYC